MGNKHSNNSSTPKPTNQRSCQEEPQSPNNAKNPQRPEPRNSKPRTNESPWKRPEHTGPPPANVEPTAAWRALVDEGNVQFAAAKNATSTTARTSAVKQALTKYNAALQLTKIPNELASTNKNMSLACGLVVADDDADSENRYYFLGEALSRAAAALTHATQVGSMMSGQWVGDVVDKLNDLVDKSLVEADCVVSARFGGVVQLFFTVVHSTATQQHLKVIVSLALLDRANKKGALAIAGGDHSGGLAVVNELAALMDSTVEWGLQPECVGFADAIHSMQVSLRNTGSLATAKKQLQNGKKLLEESLIDGIDMDKVFEAMDALRLGVVECHDMHLDIEAELLSEIGYIWRNVLKLTEAAHRAYRASLLCAHACSPRVFTSHAWFKRARDAEEAFQREEELEKKRTMDETDGPFLKELEPELTALKANNTSIDAALKYIIATYPGGTPFVEYDAATHGEDGKDKHYQSLLRKVMSKFQARKVTTQPRKTQLLYSEITLVLTRYINAAKECE